MWYMRERDTLRHAWSNASTSRVSITRDVIHHHAYSTQLITAIYLENSTAFYAAVKCQVVVCWALRSGVNLSTCIVNFGDMVGTDQSHFK